METHRPRPSDVRAGEERPDSTSTNDRNKPERRVSPRPRSRNTGIQILGGATVGLLLISGGAGGYFGYNKGESTGRDEKQAEVDRLRSQLGASEQNLMLSKKGTEISWDLSAKGFAHIADVNISPAGETKVTLSNDRHNPKACEVEMTLVNEPTLGLVTYDDSGEHTANHVINRVSNGSAETALLQRITQNRDGTCQ